MIFKTTEEQAVAIAGIASRMKTAGVTSSLIDAVSELARDDQGVFDLLAIWDEGSEADRAAAIEDLWAAAQGSEWITLPLDFSGRELTREELESCLEPGPRFTRASRRTPTGNLISSMQFQRVK